MTQQYLVIEVVNPRGQIENVYVDIESDLASVANGFRRLREDGTKVTGTFSFVERVDGVVTRYEPECPPLWARDGFRTRAAFLGI